MILSFSIAKSQNYNMSTSTVNTCAGNFYDSGGNGGNYGNSQNLTMTFCSSTPGNALQMAFSFFYLESGNDSIRFYNGSNTSSPLLGVYTGVNSPGTITASSGCITVWFTSNGSVNKPGWVAQLSCIPMPASSCPTCSGPAPANDACSGAINLGALPLPAACPSGVGTVQTTNGTNVCAVAEVPYSSLNGCQPSGNQSSPSADVWYRFNITYPTLNVTITGLTNPNIALYSGNNCNNMIPRGCAIGSGGILSTSFGGLGAGQYYLQVSGGNAADQCNFVLNLQNNRDCAGCVIQSSLTVNPPPVNGMYLPGQTVNFCYTISDYNQTSVNWLHGVIPTFGSGWNPATLTSTTPANCSGAGYWYYKNSSVTSVATGLTTGPGFYYESPLGDANGGYPDGNPGDNYGDNNPTNACDWTFCWSITTDPAAMCVPGANLNVSIDTYGDGETGSWTSYGCNGDPVVNFFAELGCCSIPNTSATPTMCNQSTGIATAMGNGTAPYSYVWRDVNGNILQTHTFSSTRDTLYNLPVGVYTVTVVDNNGCTSTATVNIININGPIPNISTYSNVGCYGQTNGSATATATGGFAPYTYLWSPSGGTAATATNLAPGTYSVTVTDNFGCANSTSITIAEPFPLSVTIPSWTNNICNGGTTGVANALVSGGNTPYTYSWSPSGGTGATANNLAAGTYTVSVVDARGCTGNASVTITQPAALNGSISSQTNVSCNGGSNGAATVTASGGTAPYTYSWSPSGGTSNTTTGLSAGSYTLTITDANGCTRNVVVTITQPSILNANISASTNVNCNGGNTGSATVTASGGTAAYSYSWSPSGGTGATATNLTAGTYTVTVTDARGCTRTASVTITQPAILNANISASTNVSCNGGSNGNATVTASGGTAPYTYSWSPSGGTGTSATALSAGTYTVTVTDSRGCTRTASVTITQPAVVSGTISASTNVSCNGGNNGSATVTATGGTAPYTYSWSPSGGTGSTASGLVAGSYTVTITDSRGCTGTATATITQPTLLSATISSSSNTTCNGSASGSATVTASGGTAPYTYLWSPSGGTAATASSLTAGTYSVTVTDANGCVRTASVTITQPTILNATASTTSASCNGANNGTASVTASGGTAPYTYLWSPGGYTTSSQSNLTAGSYTITVTDANGCTRNVTATVSQPANLTSTISSTVNASCNGGSNGSATVTVSGGTSPYTYSWSPSGGTSATATGLTAGSYSVTITDANGCTSTSSVTITQPSALSYSSTTTTATCGNSNGSGTVTVSGGTAPYTYSWSPSGGSGATATNLGAGAYTVTITDSRGCVLTASVGVSNSSGPSAAISSSSNTNCFGSSTGSATGNVTGGAAPYTYSWSPSGGSSLTATNLSAGTYTFTVTDANGCSSSTSITITQPTAVNVSSSSVNDVLCNGGNNGNATVVTSGGTPGYTYAWAPNVSTTATATNLSAGSYSVTVTDSRGCTDITTITITQPSVLTSNISASSNASCNGGSNGSATATASGGTAPYTYSWSPSGGSSATATGLTAGTYTVTITDANGCTTSASATISQPTILTSNISSQSNASCNGSSNGSATVSAGGGTAPYTYSWSPSGGTAATASGLSANTYNVTVTDALGCTSTSSVAITHPTILSASVTSSTNANCNGASTGSASVSASGGTAPYTYSWSPSGGTAATASNLAAGTYIVTITDSRGCITTASVIISQPTPVNANISSNSNVSCNGVNNGSATVSTSGGTAPYTYSWSPSGGTGSTATGLGAGTYTVTVTDANGCNDVATATINQPTTLTSTISSSSPVSCNGGNNGSASVTATGGTSPYSYSWSPSGGSSNSATGLPAGSYFVTVTDANGCTSVSTVNISQPSVLTSSISSSSNISCSGGNNGSATASVTGGTAPFNYSWSPSGGSAATATNLSSGTYTVTITDSRGCTTSASVNLSQPTPLSLSANQTPVLCNSGNSGTVSVSVSGGTSAYTYLWSPGGSTAATVTNLNAGTYTVSVTDANGCNGTASATINQPNPLSASVQSYNNILCNGDNSGNISVSVNGGTLPYNYNWSPSGGNLPAATSLTAGTYTLTITDANGCSEIISATLTEPPAITSSYTTVSSTCGSTNGSATLSVSGGTPGYSYLWTPGNYTTATVNNLGAGSYSVLITDASGCTHTANVAISNTSGPAANVISSTPVNCNGGTNGSATANVSGGAAPYSYNWSPNGGTGLTGTNLAAGTYTFSVTDANGCIATSTATVTEPSSLQINNAVTSSATCNGTNTGSASFSVSGGSPGYIYSWTPNVSSTTSANNLASGNYNVNVTDANGCTTTQTFNISEPSVLQTSVTSSGNVSCNGGNDGSASVAVLGGTTPYSYSWSPSGGTGSSTNGLSAGTYSVTVTDFNGCTSVSNVSISEPNTLNSAITSSGNASCNGAANGSATVSVNGGTAPYTYLWSPSGGTSPTANNLTQGSYVVNITDANGCATSATVNISQPVTLTAGSSSTNVSCNGGNDGSATLSINGGTAPYNVLWSNSSTSTIANNLIAGNYSATVTDANGCTTTVSVTINEPSILSANVASSSNATCNGYSDGNISINVSGGTAAYNYSWSPNVSSGSSASGLSAGNYIITITDAMGCSATQSATITEPTIVATSSSVTDATCNSSNGSITIFASGGNNGYTYNWSPAVSNTNIASGLSAGTYTVTVTDVAGCTSTLPVSLNNASGPLATLSSSNDVTCNGGNTGSATVQVTGGSAPVTYAWSHNGSNAFTQNSLSVGTYTFTATDANGCISSYNVFINEPAPLSLTPSATDAGCNGSATGSASIAATGGRAPYSYLWSNGFTGTNNSNIVAGNYNITVTDANGCISNSNTTVNEPSPLQQSATITDAGCNGATNGFVTAVATGGTAPYSYSWSNGNSTNINNNISTGSYTLIVTDANGCSSQSTYTVNQPSTLIAQQNTVSDVSCKGGNNGSASVTANGGTTPYTYSWSPSGSSGSTANNLSAGNYTVTITDANGCSATVSISVNEPTNLQATVSSIQDALCNGDATGSASVNALGGTAPYQYLWSNGSTTSSAFNLSSGTYNVQITDAQGCIASANASVSEPPVLSSTIASTQNISCPGGNDGSASVSVSGGSGPYTYNWTPGNITTSSLNNVSSGTYAVTTTDANGCSANSTVTLSEPPAISYSSSSTDATCNQSNGSATLNVSGGTAGYTYSWSPNGGNGSTANNISAGSYSVIITDQNGCTEIASVSVSNQNGPVTSFVSQNDVSCYGGNNGAANLQVSGGASPVTYNWSPSGGSGLSASNLAAGTYNFTATDANGCISTFTAVINEPSPLTSTLLSNDALCNGSADGSSTVIVNGGTANYTYLWSPSGGSNATANGLQAGSYSVNITDANGCNITNNIIINEPVPLTASISKTDALCSGDASGTAQATVSGGTAPYTYLWSTVATTQNVQNLSQGNHSVQITDANGCTTIQNINIGEPNVLSISTVTTLPNSCYQAADGSVEIAISGGTSGYSFLWSPNGGTVQNPTGMPAGTYTVTVTDANGCVGMHTVAMSEPPALSAIAANATDVSCNGGNNGSAVINVSGGTAGYNYSWSNGHSTASSNQLTAGNYNVTVTDANGCTTTTSFSINEPITLTSAASSFSTNCNGGNDGTASVIANGGITPYSYLWSQGGTSQQINNLNAGNYSVDVIDANGCLSNASTSVSEPLPVTLSSSFIAATCSNSNGSASVTANGGQGGYQYLWMPGGYTTSNVNNIPAGAYSVTVTDANGCSENITVNVSNMNGPTASIASTTNVSCNGGSNGTALVNVASGTAPFTFNWSSGGISATENNLSAGTYSVTVTDANGCISSASVNITEPATLSATTSSTDALCNNANTGNATVSANGGTSPYTYVWSSGGNSATENNLMAGNYTVTITDANGCTVAEAISVNEPTPVQVTTTSQQALCNGTASGNATTSVSGGTSGYTYLWSSGGTSSIENNLLAGNYSVTVTDANGCIATSSISVTEPTPVNVSVTPVSSTCSLSNGTASVSANGGTAPYTYLWTTGGNTSTENNLQAGNHSVTITDANGCSITQNFTITDMPSPSVNISANNVTCNDGNNGSAAAIVSSGTNPFTFQWSNGDSIQTASNLIANIYTITVTDANGCTASSTIQITEPAPLIENISSVSSTCSNANGSTSISMTGGTAPYTYLWGTGATTSGLNNVNAGSYNFTVTDANGCLINRVAVINDIAGPIASIQSSNNVDCNGGNNGSATSLGTAGTSPYTYLWNNGQATATANNLTAGNYSVTITDDYGCISTASVNITEPVAININISSSSSTCGNSNGSASATANGGTTPYTYLWSNGNTTSSISNVNAGSYTLTITDANGCQQTAIATISDQNGPSASISSSSNANCNGSNSGSATLTVTSGTAPFTYLWSNGQTTSTANNLGAGNYSVTVTDVNGCISTASTLISQPSAISTTITSNNSSCGNSNGSASLNVSGGVSPYTYQWSSGGTSSTENNLAAGSYSVTVTDANGCTFNQNLSINDNTGPSAAIASVNNANCNGGNNGSASVSVSSGTAPFTYSWSNGNTTALANNLSAGNYSVTVTDVYGCVATATVNISQPSAITATSSSANSNCGSSNGSANVTVTGGIAPYTYLWSTGGNTNSISNVPAGSYSVTITDDNGCTLLQNTSISDNNGPTTSISSSSNLNCYGINNGNATVAVSSGTAPFTYLWSNGNTSTTANNLSSGSYSVTVTDANGCVSSSNVTLTQPSQISIAATSVNSTCGNSNGSAQVNVTGGTGSYTYSWSPSGGNTNSISNLATGTYNVTVTDGNGCTQSQAVNIQNTNGPTASVANVQAVNCFGGNNGSATINTSGGTAPYTYSWWPSGGNSNQANSLAAGNYTVTITDANGCTSIQTFTITQPATLLLNMAQSNATCGNANGAAQVSVQGGAPGYTYLWFPSGGNNNTAINLSAGNYSVTVTDNNGCIANAYANITNTQGGTVNIISATNPTCNGCNNGSATAASTGGTAPYTYLWSPSGGSSANASNLSAGTYTVTMTDANGCTSSSSVIISQPNAMNLQTSSTQASCGAANGSASVNASGGTAPYTYSWSPTGGTNASANNLAGGTYTVTVTDVYGNQSSQQIVVSTLNGPSATISSTSNVNCYGTATGSASVNVSGGTAPYTYNWSNSVSTTSSANDLAAGQHVVTITDSYGCSTSMIINITQATDLLSSTTTTPSLCGQNNGSATVSVSGGTGPYQYQWLPSGGNNSTANNLMSGYYNVIISDQHGCHDTATAFVNSPSNMTMNIASSNALCNGMNNGTATVTVNGGTAPYTYQWSPSVSTTNAAYTLYAGNYSVMITDGSGCNMVANISISEPQPVTAQILGQNQLCIGQETVLQAYAYGGTTPYNFNWSNGTSSQTLNIVGGSVTSYTLYVSDAYGCPATVQTFNTTVYPSLSVTATGSGTICSNQLATIDAMASGGNGQYNYSWNNGVLTSAGSTFNLTHDSTFTVVVTDGCGTPPATATVQINVTAVPVVTMGPAIFLGCSPLSVQFSNLSNVIAGSIYHWNFGDGQTSNAANPSHTYTIAGTYDVSLSISTSNGCSATQSVNDAVTVFNKPNAAFAMSSYVTSILNATIVFNDQSYDAVSWSWNFGDGGTSQDKNPIYTYADTGTYQIMLVIKNSAGCYDTTYNNVRVQDDYAVYIPNAFTPNDDGTNDAFGPYGVGYTDMTMLIFDRWGMEIYSSENKSQLWDGTYKKSGTPCQADVYVYQIRLKDHKGIPHDYTGHVSLVR